MQLCRLARIAPELGLKNEDIFMLNSDWKPEFGEIYTWLAADCCNKVGIFINNNFGDIPKCILSLEKVEERLDALNEFIFEESESYRDAFFRKDGGTTLEIYSSVKYRDYASRDEIESTIKRKSRLGFINEYALPACKGLYVYHALEGDMPGMDRPVGFDGDADMGDYFKFLSPTVFASIEDFPDKFRSVIAKSRRFKFSELKMIKTVDLNRVFDSV